jgi:hypothetical protein
MITVVEIVRGVRTCDHTQEQKCETDARYKLRSNGLVKHLCKKHFKSDYPKTYEEYQK